MNNGNVKTVEIGINDRGNHERVSTTWSYLDTLVKAYEELIKASTSYSAILKVENGKPFGSLREITFLKKELCASLYSFYIMCSFKFNEYLRTEEFKSDFPNTTITSSAYSSLFVSNPSNKQLFAMLEVISHWSQKYGAFRTLVTISDPGQAGRQTKK